MKTRSGFVSNSSSSSFVFALPKGHGNILKISLDFDLTSVGKIYKTRTQFDKYLRIQSGCKSVKEAIEYAVISQEQYDECIKQFKEGKEIAFGHVTNEGDPVEDVLCNDNWKLADPEVKQIGEIGF